MNHRINTDILVFAAAVYVLAIVAPAFPQEKDSRSFTVEETAERITLRRRQDPS